MKTDDFSKNHVSKVAVANNVSKVYSVGNTDYPTINSISFELFNNEFLSIVGPSGSGKSTILRMLADLEAPTSGEVYVLPDATVPGGTGFMLQTPTLFHWKTVDDHLRLPFQLGVPQPEGYQDRISEVLKLTALDRFRKRFPHELSGGMQRVLGLCMQLVTQPVMLLMDEPLSGIDEITRERVGDFLTELWNVQKQSTILVTHSIPEAVMLSDRVLVLSPRPAQLRGSVKVLLPRPRDRQVRDSSEFASVVRDIRSLLRFNELQP